MTVFSLPWMANAVTAPTAVTPANSLVERVRAGDARAIGELYDRCHGKVYAFARRMIGDEQAAWDLVQEVFIAVPAALDGFRGECQLETFVLSIAVHRAHNYVRSAVRQRRLRERVALEPQRASDTPEEHVERQQLRAQLREAMDGLSIDHQTVFVLCDIEERTSVEVAQLLQISDATVRTRLFYARKKLREFFEAAQRKESSR